MGDITNPRLLYLKAVLFVVTGLFASGLILLDSPRVEVAVLLVIAVWCFARAYYFAFYVIEHYIDPGYRFAGLWSFARYTWERRRLDTRPPAPATSPTTHSSQGSIEPGTTANPAAGAVSSEIPVPPGKPAR